MKLKLLTCSVILILAGLVVVLAGAAGALWSLGTAGPPTAQAIRIAPAAPLVPAAPQPVATLPPEATLAAPTALPTATGEPTPATVPAAPVETSAPAGTVDVVPPQVGDSVQTRLLIPRLNLDIPVVVAPVVGESWQVDHLQQAAGHLAGTAAPGANSNAVLAGHVSLLDGSPGPFAQLNQLAPTDELWLVQGQQRFRYVVDRRQVVEPAAIEVTYPTETARITLITCDGWNDADGRYVNRLVVAGFLVDG